MENTQSHKVLGLTIDENLTWTEHCNNVCKKIKSKLFLLRKLKTLLPKAARLQFYNSFILPHFDYCSNVWLSGKLANLRALELLHKRAMRLILGVPARTPSKELYFKMNWMSLEYRSHYTSAILVYKCLHDLTPSYLNFFHFTSGRTRAAARNDLIIPSAKKLVLKNSFCVQGAKTFNSLPSTIRNLPRLKVFKGACFKHFMSSFSSFLSSLS